MIEWILSSSILILLVLVLRRLLRGRVSARLGYALWLLVLIRLLVPGTVGESALSVQSQWEASKSYEVLEILPKDAYHIPNGDVVIVDDRSSSRYSSDDFGSRFTDSGLYVPAHRIVTLTRVRNAFTTLWKLGMAATAALLLLSNATFYRKLRRDRQTVHCEISTPVYMTDVITSPCLFGLFCPAIYVPSSVAGDETALRHVLAHEQAHRLHGDHLWAALRGLCLVLHWYHPLVWRAAALSRRDCELACDESAVQALGEDSRAAYGRTLVGLAEKRTGLLRCATSMSGSDLKERIAALVKRPKTRKTALVILILAVILFAVSTFTGGKTPWIYDGQVIRVSEEDIWIAPSAAEDREKAGCEAVLYTGQPAEELAVGDFVRVTMGSGGTDDSYPPAPPIKKVERRYVASEDSFLLCDGFFRLITGEDWRPGKATLADGWVEEDGDKRSVIFQIGEERHVLTYRKDENGAWTWNSGPGVPVPKKGWEAQVAAFNKAAENWATVEMRGGPDGAEYPAYQVDSDWLLTTVTANFGYYTDPTPDTLDTRAGEGMYLEANVPGSTLQIYENDVVYLYDDTGTTVWYPVYQYGPDVFYDSIFDLCRVGYDRLTMGTLSDQSVAAEAGQADEVLPLLWQNWLARLYRDQVPGSRWELDGYRVGNCAIVDSISNDDGSVRAAFELELLVEPTNLETTAWWAGNGVDAAQVYGQEYEGWILSTYRGWLVRDAESGLWFVADYGTGAYPLEDLLERCPLDVDPSFLRDAET